MHPVTFTLSLVRAGAHAAGSPLRAAEDNDRPVGDESVVPSDEEDEAVAGAALTRSPLTCAPCDLHA